MVGLTSRSVPGGIPGFRYTATATIKQPGYFAAPVSYTWSITKGDHAPSTADLQVTRQLLDAANAVDIDLFDHVIVSDMNADPLGVGHYSFRTAGIL